MFWKLVADAQTRGMTSALPGCLNLCLRWFAEFMSLDHQWFGQLTLARILISSPLRRTRPSFIKELGRNSFGRFETSQAF